MRISTSVTSSISELVAICPVLPPCLLLSLHDNAVPVLQEGHEAFGTVATLAFKVTCVSGAPDDRHCRARARAPQYSWSYKVGVWCLA